MPLASIHVSLHSSGSHLAGTLLSSAVPQRYVQLLLAALALLGAVVAWRRGGKFQYLWTGLAVEFVGFFADGYWHLAIQSDDIGTVPPAHWVTMVGMVLVLIGTIVAYRELEGPLRWLLAVTAAVAVVQFTGALWDNWLHFQGIEPAPTAMPHLMKNLGLFATMALLAVASLVVNRKSIRTMLGPNSET